MPQDLARGAFTYAPPTTGQLSRAMDVDRRFADLGLVLVDASVVALAESVGVNRLATRDVRHFGAVRLTGGRAFDLVVDPTDPDNPDPSPRRNGAGPIIPHGGSG